MAPPGPARPGTAAACRPVVGGGASISRADSIAETLEGFRKGRGQDIDVVRGWIGAVLHGGRWRFRDPEGVAQEVLLKLVEITRAGRVQDPGSFQKFVYTVAKNTCVTIYHRERSRAQLEEPELAADEIAGSQNPAEELERSQRIEIAVYVFQRLSAPCRQLWSWIYRDKLSAQEAGERLGISANNVRVRVHRCTQKARAIYRELDSRAGETRGEVKEASDV